MNLLARMTENGKTTGTYSDILPLRFLAAGWEAQYAHQLAADAQANEQTLAQMENDIQACLSADRARQCAA